MFKIKIKVKSFLKQFKFVQKILIRKMIRSGELVLERDLLLYIESASSVFLKKTSFPKLRVGLVEDFGTPLPEYEFDRSYNPKFKRFLNNNNIGFENFDIMASDWIEKSKKLDIIVWHTKSDPSTQEIAKNKIYFLEKVIGKKCIPSFDALWTYENKINTHYLYKYYNLPEIPTIVTHTKEEALSIAEKVSYPMISKLATGSASYGVFKIDNLKKAKRLINKVFSPLGKTTYFGFDTQKDYLYIQKFISDADYDLRVIVVGNKLFGYYRYPNKGDFKASGAGNYEKKEIPTEALDLAFKVKKCFNVPFLATDLLYSKSKSKYYIIESSIFIGVDTPEQLKVKGKSGYYLRNKEGDYTFVEGKFWIQELMLLEGLEDLIMRKKP